MRLLKSGNELPHSKLAPRCNALLLRYRLIKWLRGASDKTGTALSIHEDTSEDDRVDPFNPFPHPITIEITDVFDLHTIPPRDVKRAVEEYLLEARWRGFRSVRIIHGKGIGVQREMVRSILAHTAFVRDFGDAPPQAGGIGATIAHLSIDTD